MGRLKLVPPIGKRAAVNHAPHQRRLRPARLNDKTSSPLARVRRGNGAITTEPPVGTFDDQAMQRTVLHGLAIIEREQQRERRVAMSSGARWIRRPRQKVDEAIGESLRQWREDCKPSRGGPIFRCEQFQFAAASFSSQPQPYGRSNEPRCGPESVASSPMHIRRCETLIKVPARRFRVRMLRMIPQQAGQRPVHVHARVPVIAAVKSRMQ